jgi:hypothetical protein
VQRRSRIGHDFQVNAVQVQRDCVHAGLLVKQPRAQGRRAVGHLDPCSRIHVELPQRTRAEAGFCLLVRYSVR